METRVPNQAVLLQDLAYQPDPAKPILCRIRMINETALIPDLQRVELALLAQDDTPDPKRTALQ